MPITTKDGTQYELYADYLLSQHWQQTKQRKVKRDAPVCYICNDTPADLHHLTYERLGQERLSDLIWLCRLHHEAVHKIGRVTAWRMIQKLKKKAKHKPNGRIARAIERKAKPTPEIQPAVILRKQDGESVRKPAKSFVKRIHQLV